MVLSPQLFHDLTLKRLNLADETTFKNMQIVQNLHVSKWTTKIEGTPAAVQLSGCKVLSFQLHIFDTHLFHLSKCTFKLFIDKKASLLYIATEITTFS